MRNWVKVAVPLGIAIVMISVLVVGFGSPASEAARGGNKAQPTLTLVPNPHAEVGQIIAVMGDGFPKNTAAFVIVSQVSPVHDSLPSILVETDGAGSFETATSFSEPGTYEFSVCSYLKKRGGSWDCRSVDPKSIEVTD